MCINYTLVAMTSEEARRIKNGWFLAYGFKSTQLTRVKLVNDVTDKRQ